MNVDGRKVSSPRTAANCLQLKIRLKGSGLRVVAYCAGKDREMAAEVCTHHCEAHSIQI